MSSTYEVMKKILCMGSLLAPMEGAFLTEKAELLEVCSDAREHHVIFAKPRYVTQYEGNAVDEGDMRWRDR